MRLPRLRQPPRVRLVRDNQKTFHFQWNEPLNEERIVLVRFSGVEVIHNDYSNLVPRDAIHTSKTPPRIPNGERLCSTFRRGHLSPQRSRTAFSIPYIFGITVLVGNTSRPPAKHGRFSAELRLINDAGNLSRIPIRSFCAITPIGITEWMKPSRLPFEPSRVTFWEEGHGKIWTDELERRKERNAD